MTVNSAALDSVTLIHATKEFLSGVSYSDRERDMARRAKILIHTLAVERAMIVVPTVVVAEYLIGVEPEHHEQTLAAFRENFEMPPFDLKAVSIAAKLWRAHRSLPAEEQLGRMVLKADVLIIATARAFGVTRYYSNDKGSRRLAEQAGLRSYYPGNQDSHKSDGRCSPAPADPGHHSVSIYLAGVI